MQDRTHDPARGRQTFLDHRLFQIMQMRAVIFEQARLVGNRPLLLDRVQQAQPPIGAQGRAGDSDPRPIDPPFRIEVDNLDLHAAFRQRDCRGHAANPAANDKRLMDAADALPCHAAKMIKP